MPMNGYWIECIPVIDNNDDTESFVNSYNAYLTAIPEVKAVADSPDQAINRLRSKLRALNRYYRIKGQNLPEKDNPLHPPKISSETHRWISIYVQISDSCSNKSN